jgi:hypothetical protein
MINVHRAFCSHFIALIVFLSVAYANRAEFCINPQEQTANTLIPVHVQLSGQYKDWFALSAFGEGGYHYWRGNGTIGVALRTSSFVKFSAEYLAQNLGFNFLSGTTRKWVHQITGGVAYRHALNLCGLPLIEASGYCAHSFSRRLTPKFCSGTGQFSVRTLTGASAAGGELGMTLVPWCTSTLLLHANADWIQFNQGASKHHFGLGGTIDYAQQIVPDVVELRAHAEWRNLFFYYRGAVNIAPESSVQIGGWADYTVGRHSLPNVFTTGMQISFDLGTSACPKMKKQEKEGLLAHSSMEFLDDENEDEPMSETDPSATGSWVCCWSPCSSRLLNFVKGSAARMPVVFARPSSLPDCQIPQAGSPFTQLFSNSSNVFSSPSCINISSAFIGSNLSYTIIDVETITMNRTPTFSINGPCLTWSGTVSATSFFLSGSYVLIIEASNACGSIRNQVRLDFIAP